MSSDYFKVFHKTTYLGFCLLFVMSCDIQKRALKSKTATNTKADVTTTQTKVTEEKREGGQITTGIIPIEDRERDESGAIKELVQELRDGALTKTIYYKPDGTSQVDCKCDEIDKRVEEYITKVDNSVTESTSKDKEREKEENFDSSFILYIVLGAVALIGLLGSIALFFLYKTINKNSAMMNNVLTRL